MLDYNKIKKIVKTSSNKLKIKNLKASSDYYDKIANAIGDYRNVESDVSKNKGKKDVQDKLDKISNEIDEAYSKYKSSIDSDSKSEEDKQKEKKSVNLIKIYLVLWIKSEMAINLKIVNKLKRSAKTCDCKFQYKLIGVFKCVISFLYRFSNSCFWFNHEFR